LSFLSYSWFCSILLSSASRCSSHAVTISVVVGGIVEVKMNVSNDVVVMVAVVVVVVVVVVVSGAAQGVDIRDLHEKIRGGIMPMRRYRDITDGRVLMSWGCCGDKTSFILSGMGLSVFL
jgi:low affinity Fe/Cu permease